MATVNIDKLADEIVMELRSYEQDVTDGIKEAVEQTAKQCLSDIKKNSPSLTGSYKKGWKKKKEYESVSDIRFRIYNSTDYQLTHLLENGHAKRNGGRVEGYPHIGPAEKKAIKELEGKAKVVIRR